MLGWETADLRLSTLASFLRHDLTPKALLRVAQGCNAKRATLGLSWPVFFTLKALLPTRSGRQ